MLPKLVKSNKHCLVKYRIPMGGMLMQGAYALTSGKVSHHGVALYKDGQAIKCYDLGKDPNTNVIIVYQSPPQKIEEHFQQIKCEPQLLDFIDLEQHQIPDIQKKFLKTMDAINSSNFKYTIGKQDCHWFAQTLMENPEQLEKTLKKIQLTKQAQEDRNRLKEIWGELWRYKYLH